MRHNPFKIVEMFEETVADYTRSICRVGRLKHKRTISVLQVFAS